MYNFYSLQCNNVNFMIIQNFITQYDHSLIVAMKMIFGELLFGELFSTSFPRLVLELYTREVSQSHFEREHFSIASRKRYFLTRRNSPTELPVFELHLFCWKVSHFLAIFSAVSSKFIENFTMTKKDS